MILLAEAERLLVPVRTSRSLAWDDRVLTLEPGEEYEMPTVIRYQVLSSRKVIEGVSDEEHRPRHPMHFTNPLIFNACTFSKVAYANSFIALLGHRDKGCHLAQTMMMGACA